MSLAAQKARERDLATWFRIDSISWLITVPQSFPCATDRFRIKKPAWYQEPNEPSPEFESVADRIVD